MSSDDKGKEDVVEFDYNKDIALNYEPAPDSSSDNKTQEKYYNARSNDCKGCRHQIKSLSIKS